MHYGLHTPEPVVCVKRGGPTPNHPEPGRETPQRRGYWREARWESRSVRHTNEGRVMRTEGRVRSPQSLSLVTQSSSLSPEVSGAAWSSGSSSGS